MTFFLGIFVLMYRWEADGLHCVTGYPIIEENEIDECNFIQKLFCLGSKYDPNPDNLERNLKDSAAALFFQNWFVSNSFVCVVF